jgi:hypothetical protein
MDHQQLSLLKHCKVPESTISLMNMCSFPEKQAHEMLNKIEHGNPLKQMEKERMTY